MHYKTCEICGMKAGRVGGQKRTFMAKFPLNEDTCKRWVQVTGKEDLAYVPIEKLHNIKYICGNHFRPQDFKKKRTQLKRNAVPSVLLTAKPLPDAILKGFPLHISVEPSTSTAATETVDMGTKNSISNNIPCSSRLTLGPLIYNEHDYFQPYVVIPESSTSTVKAGNSNSSERKRPRSPSKFDVTLKINNNPRRKTLTVEAENSNNSKKKKPCKPKSSTETKAVNLMSPRETNLLKKLKKSRNEVKELKKRIREIEKITAKLPVLKSILQSSVKNQNRKPNGQRWTNFDKFIGLAIYKNSPEAYKYLSQLLPMPSIRTLQTVLENMKMTPGIDISDMAHVKEQAEIQTDENRTYLNIYDEIAIKEETHL